jgi:hypothetical protein
MRAAATKRAVQTAKPQRSRVSRTFTFPAPVRGMITNENAAMPKPGGAQVLDNFRPEADGASVRAGSSLYATTQRTGRVHSLMPYVFGSVEKLFAGVGGALIDTSLPLGISCDTDTVLCSDGTVTCDSSNTFSGQIGDVTGLADAPWAFVQFTTSGGTYLICVNGSDTRRIFDGSTWATTPAITGVSSSVLSHVWVFKNRLFFVQKDTMDVWYLAVDSIGGAATKLPLGGNFTRGGTLLFGASWSADTGAGFGEKCVFVTTEGEVAVFQGTDPSSSTTWALEGVYRIGKPVGGRATFKAGGDLAIATDIGIIPMSQVITTDLGALGQRAITRPIEDEWAKLVVERLSLYPWHIELWPRQQLAIVAMPSFDGAPAVCLVANVRTGAWARYTGWTPQSLALHKNRAFFGDTSGNVIEAETGGNDQGSPYTAIYVPLPSDCGLRGSQKVVSMARSHFVSDQSVSDKTSACANHAVTLPSAPAASPFVGGSSAWDVGKWDEMVWSASSERATTARARWMAAQASGIALATATQVTISQNVAPIIRLTQSELMFEVGASPI